MQGVIAKPFIISPVVINSRINSCIAARSEVATNLTLSVKPTLSLVKLNSAACSSHICAMSNPFINKTQTNKLVFNSSLPSKRGSYLPRASKGLPDKTQKPKWWLRSLAGLPYLLPFLDQMTWTLAHPNNPTPFLESFENFIVPLISTMFALPKFILMGYPIILYFWIVRREKWPHFLRFHVMMGILMGGLVQVIGISSNWLPSWSYPPHFWSVASFLFLVTIFECIRCALFGKYSSLPFVKDAAFVHLDPNLR